MVSMPAKTAAVSLFSSCEESTKPEVAQINGSIPSWLNGTFIRTGPGKWDFPGGFTMNHWFDGYALLSKFTINASQPQQTVALEQKYLKSDAYTRTCCAGKPVITEFGTRSYPDPKKSFLSRLISAVLPIELSDNGNLNLFTIGTNVGSGGGLFATTETCFFRDVNPENLESTEKFDTNKCFGVNIASAHPQMDPETGITYNVGCSVLTGLKYNIIKIPAPSQAAQTPKELLHRSKIIATIPSSHTGMLSYMHSFAMTRQYIILIEQPYVMNIAKAAKTIFKGNPVFKDFLEWKPELQNRFHIIEKGTGTVIKTEYYAADNFFYVHTINAYEDDNQVVVDLMVYKNADFVDAMYLSTLREGRLDELSGLQASAQRFVLPLAGTSAAAAVPSNLAVIPEATNLVQIKSLATAYRAGKCIILTPEILTAPGVENPTMNRNYAGKKYSYFYTPGAPGGQHKYSNSIIKYDLRRKEYAAWVGMVGQLPGEPQFIPNPLQQQQQQLNSDSSLEDDGVLISIISDTTPGKSAFMLFLDAKTMKELGRATFQTHLPLALHGIFLPSASPQPSLPPSSSS